MAETTKDSAAAYSTYCGGLSGNPVTGGKGPHLVHVAADEIRSHLSGHEDIRIVIRPGISKRFVLDVLANVSLAMLRSDGATVGNPSADDADHNARMN